eukprot:6178444-Pleurochrysis_carterae.AAC.1
MVRAVCHWHVTACFLAPLALHLHTFDRWMSYTGLQLEQEEDAQFVPERATFTPAASTAQTSASRDALNPFAGCTLHARVRVPGAWGVRGRLVDAPLLHVGLRAGGACAGAAARGGRRPPSTRRLLTREHAP